MPTPHNPPAAVRRALRKLGADIHDARRRRRLPMAVVAERAFTSRSTLQRVEGGDTNVSIGIYAGVLQALGLLDGLINIADISNDSVGQALARAELPRHVLSNRRPEPHAMADFEAADHRAHSPRRGNGRRSPAHLRARLLPRWRAAEDLGHRPTRQSLDRQNPRLQY